MGLSYVNPGVGLWTSANMSAWWQYIYWIVGQAAPALMIFAAASVATLLVVFIRKTVLQAAGFDDRATQFEEDWEDDDE